MTWIQNAVLIAEFTFLFIQTIGTGKHGCPLTGSHHPFQDKWENELTCIYFCRFVLIGRSSVAIVCVYWKYFVSKNRDNQKPLWFPWILRLEMDKTYTMGDFNSAESLRNDNNCSKKPSVFMKSTFELKSITFSQPTLKRCLK